MVSLGWWVHKRDLLTESELDEAIADVSWVVRQLNSFLSTDATSPGAESDSSVGPPPPPRKRHRDYSPPPTRNRHDNPPSPPPHKRRRERSPPPHKIRGKFKVGPPRGASKHVRS